MVDETGTQTDSLMKHILTAEVQHVLSPRHILTCVNILNLKRSYFINNI